MPDGSLALLESFDCPYLTFQPELVAFERGDGLSKQLLGVLVSGFDSAHVYLLPFDGHIVCFEYSFDGFGYLGTNTVSWDQSGGVFTTIFGRLENIGLYRGISLNSRIRF